MKINICKIIFVYYVVMVSALFASSSDTSYNVPLENGRVVDSFSGKDLQNREILIIMDAHCNHEAQKNIAGILAHYTNRFSPVLIGLEGASGAMDVSDLSEFPIPEVKEYVLNHFVKEGKINGVEYFNILHKNLAQSGSENSFVTIGVEDRDSYIKNLNAYNSVKADSVKPIESVDYLIKKFNEIAEENYTLHQKQFNAMDQARRSKRITYLHYCKYLLELCEETRLDISLYKTISLVAESLMAEQKIDTFRIEFERKKVARLLALKDLEDESLVLNRKFKLGEISPLQYYTRLKELCRDNNVDLSPYKQIGVYMGYLDKINRIDHSKLYSETIVLSEILAKRIFGTTLNWKIYLWNRRVNLLSKLFTLDLAPAEFAFFNDGDNWFNIDEMNRFLSDLSCSPELAKDIMREFTLVCGSAGKAVEFYKTANKRNELIINNLLSDMDIEGVKKAVLVVGGFHIKGISSLLKDSGISYYVVSPNMKTYDHQGLYESRLKNEMSLFEKNIESSISQLADQSKSTITASLLAIASLLADNSLARPGMAQVFRVELKSILTVEGIRAIEQTGLYRLPELKKRVEELLQDQWAEKNFPQLDFLRVFRDFDGELIMELKINGVLYTFAGYTSQLFNKVNGENPERVLSQFKINGNTVSVISGSELELGESLLAGNRILDVLSKQSLSLDELSAQLSIPEDTLNPILIDWVNQGIVQVSPFFKFSLTRTALNVLPVAKQFSGRFYANAKDISAFNNQLKDNFNRLDINEITIDSAVPLSVQVDFFTRLSGDISDISLGKQDSLLFTIQSEQRVFYAQLSDRGEAGTGTRLEFRVIDNFAKPFDKRTRNEKLASIYNDPAVMDEILNPGDDALEPVDSVNLNTAKEVSRIVMPVSNQGEYNNVLNDKLFSYIGDPDEFVDKNKALIFDLDGTLSARTKYGFEPISDEIVKTLKRFVSQGIHVVVISGQPYDEISRRFLDLFDKKERRFLHLYPNNGSAGVGFDENGEKVLYYERALTEVVPEEEFDVFTGKLHSIAKNLGLEDYETRFGTDQITFRLPNSSNLERESLFELMKKYIQHKYPELRIAVAGRYSIDITLNDKSDGVRYFLQNRVKVKPENVLFFGDTYQGNDAPLSDGAPDSTHFHVGTLLPGEEIMPNVLKTDSRGVETTEDILLKLDWLINMLIVDKIDPQSARRITNNLNNFYDFSERFSTTYTDDQLIDIINRDLSLTAGETGWEQQLSGLAEGNFNADFVGVGATGVNLSYIAAANPVKSILTEPNPWVPLYYVPLRNVLIDIAPNRVEYISMLTGKPMEIVDREGVRYYRSIPKITGKHPVEISEHASIDEIYNFFSNIPLYDDYLRETISKITKFFPEDKRGNLEKFWRLQANKESFQSLSMLKSMSEADKSLGIESTWMSNEEKYKELRDYVRQGRLFAVSADWLNSEANRVFAMLNASGDKVSLVNLAGLMDSIPDEKYPDGSDPLIRLIGNIASLPKTENFRLLNQSAETTMFDDNSMFNGSAFESEYAKAVKARENKPVDTTVLTLDRSEYKTVILELLNDIGRDDLASFYANSSRSFRDEILTEFAGSVIKGWANLRSKIRNNEQLTNDEKIKSLELSSVFGYSLKDMETVVGVFASPSDYMVNLFALPFGEQSVFLSRALSDMKSELAATVSYFSKEPDIILLDSSVLTGSANTSNIALGKVIEQFKKEHQKAQGRRVLVVAVDAQANGMVFAKNEIERVLYTRGDTADIFDQVLAFPFDITNPDDSSLYHNIKDGIDTEHLEKRAMVELSRQGIMDISDERIQKYIEKIVIGKVREKKLQSALISRFGMSIENISSRVTVLSADGGFLAEFAGAHGTAIRDLQPPEVSSDTVQPAGIFLIDILRSAGTESLPADLSIVGVRNSVVINDEYKQRGFDKYLSLFKTVYSLFESKGIDQITYGDFVSEIDRARGNGRISGGQEKLLKSPQTIKNLFRFKADIILTQKDFVTFFMNILYGDLSVKDKRIVHNLSARQLKLYILTGILSARKVSADTPVMLKDIHADLKEANLDIGDVASYLEVDIPARPISGNLNKALDSQRALDTSA